MPIPQYFLGIFGLFQKLLFNGNFAFASYLRQQRIKGPVFLLLEQSLPYYLAMEFQNALGSAVESLLSDKRIGATFLTTGQ